MKGTGFTGCGKTRVFLRSEGYGLQPVHKGTKTMGFTGCGKTQSCAKSVFREGFIKSSALAT